MSKPLVFLSLLVLLSISCFEKPGTGTDTGDTAETTDTGDTGPEPVVSPGFEAVVHPILIERCGECHGIVSLESDLDISTYETLMESTAIIPYDSGHSLLVLLGPHADGGWYTDDERSQVMDWIDAGAPND